MYVHIYCLFSSFVCMYIYTISPFEFEKGVSANHSYTQCIFLDILPYFKIYIEDLTLKNQKITQCYIYIYRGYSF